MKLALLLKKTHIWRDIVLMFAWEVKRKAGDLMAEVGPDELTQASFSSVFPFW